CPDGRDLSRLLLRVKGRCPADVIAAPVRQPVCVMETRAATLIVRLVRDEDTNRTVCLLFEGEPIVNLTIPGAVVDAPGLLDRRLRAQSCPIRLVWRPVSSRRRDALDETRLVERPGRDRVATGPSRCVTTFHADLLLPVH